MASLVPNNLWEPVWLDEFDSQLVPLQDAIRGLNNIYERLRQQQAPPQLRESVFDIRQKILSTLEEASDLRVCFPEKPPEPR